MFTRKNSQLLIATTALVLGSAAHAELRIGTGAAQGLYEQYCAACHGKQMEGGIGGSLVDDVWKHGSSDEAISRAISKGIAGTEMIGWEGTLSAEQIRSLVILMREQRHLASKSKTAAGNNAGVYEAAGYRFRVTPVMDGSTDLWGMTFLPDGSALVTQKDGVLWHWHDGKRSEVKGVPSVHHQGQGGLLDVIAHPAYASNGWIYLSYAEKVAGHSNASTTILRATLRDGALQEQKTVFSVPADKRQHSGHHFGSRFAFIGNDLFFTIGDAGNQDNAQKLNVPTGKVHRIHDDGRVPADNPFAKTADAFPTIWTYGNRNPQGLVYDAIGKRLWAAEHGPRGGDEINLIEKGKNYGWPVITYGMNYNGTPISNKTQQDGMEQPKHYWTPSIAVSNIDIYRGKPFANWDGKLLAASLSAQELRLLTLDGDKIVKDELLLKNIGRLRDVQTGPDGAIYLLVSDEGEQRYQLRKLERVGT